MKSAVFKALSVKDTLRVFTDKPDGSWLLRESSQPNMLVFEIKTSCNVDAYRLCYTLRDWRCVRDNSINSRLILPEDQGKAFKLLTEAVEELFTQLIEAGKFHADNLEESGFEFKQILPEETYKNWQSKNSNYDGLPSLPLDLEKLKSAKRSNYRP